VRDEDRTPGSACEATPRVFINYRRQDTAADARLLYERLARRLGVENVFLDVVDLAPGTSWLDAIKSQGGSCGIFVVVIGPGWLVSVDERAADRLADTGQDIVKLELELALSRNSGVDVLPVLVGDARMPAANRLPRSIRALSGLQPVELRHTHYDEDIDHLISAMEALARRRAAHAAEGDPDDVSVRSSPPSSHPNILPSPKLPAPPHREAHARHPDAMAPPPDQRHYEAVARYMADEGTVVPVLGARVFGSLPDADEVAAQLAQRFELEPGPLELPRVAQAIYVLSGRPDLLRTLRRILTPQRDPNEVHRFLARLPQQLERFGLPIRYQMIVTTNYDSGLEQAFEDEQEPYDLAVYVGAGEDRGKFVHFPFDRDPELISVPNRYTGFPIDDFGDLERSVIVKVHGGVFASADAERWKETFVVTEDQYIDYLSGAAIESLVPVQILAKLTESHCLFLGYAMRDWTLRVFLKRIWRGEALGSRSWAIERRPDALEKDFWTNLKVECFAASLDEYVKQLSQALALRAVPT